MAIVKFILTVLLNSKTLRILKKSSEKVMLFGRNVYKVVDDVSADYMDSVFGGAAFMGNYIFVSKNLVNITCAEDHFLLAFVIGHELGHKVLGHMSFFRSKQFIRYSKTTGLMSLVSPEYEAQADIFAIQVFCLHPSIFDQFIERVSKIHELSDETLDTLKKRKEAIEQKFGKW
jgi:Zn-dependent peptidase ImmA (M78 family)